MRGEAADRLLSLVSSGLRGASARERLEALGDALEQALPTSGLHIFTFNPLELRVTRGGMVYTPSGVQDYLSQIAQSVALFRDWDPASGRDYMEHVLPHDWYASVMFHGRGRSHSLNDHAQRRGRGKGALLVEHWRRAGVHRLLGAHVLLAPDRCLALNICRSRRQPEFSSRDHHLIDRALGGIGDLVLAGVLEDVTRSAPAPVGAGGFLLFATDGSLKLSGGSGLELAHRIDANRGERDPVLRIVAAARRLTRVDSGRSGERYCFPQRGGGWIEVRLSRSRRQREGYEVLAVVEELRAGVAPTPDDRARRLTPREWEVTRLLSRGLAPKEIARMLGIAGETTKLHLRRAFAKTETKGQADLAAWFLGLGR